MEIKLQIKAKNKKKERITVHNDWSKGQKQVANIFYLLSCQQLCYLAQSNFNIALHKQKLFHLFDF